MHLCHGNIFFAILIIIYSRHAKYQKIFCSNIFITNNNNDINLVKHYLCCLNIANVP